MNEKKEKCKHKQGNKCTLLGAGDISTDCYYTDDEPCEDYEEAE